MVSSAVKTVAVYAGANNYHRPGHHERNPCFRGTRVPFKNLIDYLEGGHPLSEFLRQFPSVTHEMAVQALEEAKNSLLAKIA